MSSLIFVVILAVWAVYLVQHWVRRRDHVATARSVDRFSEAMRVLERRRALPRPDVAHTPPSYSVSPLRPARPEVVVKRGMPQPTPATAARPSGATAVGPTPVFRRAKRAAQLRALALLVASIAMVTLVILGVGPVLHWAWSFAGVGILAVTLVVVRRSASAARRTAMRARRAERVRPVQAPARAQVDAAVAAPLEAETRTTAEADASPLAAQAQARAAVGTVQRPARRAVDLAAARPAPYDIDAVESSLVAATTTAPAEQAVASAPVEELAPAPGSWSPTPVPPPTYTLKAKAYRGVPTGSTELPADGTEMALDEEFEELPRIERVV